MNPLYKKVLIFILLDFIIILVYLAYNEDAQLNPEARAFMDLSNPVKPTDAHAILYTLDAPIDADFITLGHFAITDYLNNKDNSVLDFDNKLDFSSNSYSSCRNNIELCVEEFKSGDRIFTQFNEIEQTLSNRIKLLESSPPIGSIFEPIATTPILNNKARIAFQNSDFLRLIHLFINSDPEYVLGYLIADTQLKRNQLKTSSSLINIMITTSMIKKNIELLQLLSSQKNTGLHLPEFSFEEINMQIIFSKELRLFYNLLNEFYSGRNLEGKVTLEETIFDPIAKKSFIKPNKSFNRYFKMLQTQYWHPAQSLDEYLFQDFSILFEKNYSINNFIGESLNKAAIPAYSKYQFEILNLSCLTTKYNKSINVNYNQTPLVTEVQCNLIDQLLNESNLNEESE